MRIKKVRFKTPPFRMLADMELEMAKRLTVIAGHNGIGKSTILGLIANGSELKSQYGKTLLGKPFQAQLHELFYLDEVKDYVSKRGDKPMFELEYEKEDSENLIKTCKVSKHTEKKKTRLKVVPRGTQDGWDVGESAKVSIPTIFLSMSRMLPLGETSDLLKEGHVKLNDNDVSYIHEKFKFIISSQVKDSDNTIRHELKSTTKRSILPEFEHSAKSISLGQDSLSSIITAIASFNRLKREYQDYKGGLLLIDEIDAGFHPRAQIKLIQLLKKEAKRLNLQIIMTTHSLTIIKEVLKLTDDKAKNEYKVDAVIYLSDVYSPKLLTDVSYERIKMDMLGKLPTLHDERPILKFYFEDSEAAWFCKEILKIEKFDIDSYCHYKPLFIGAKLGSDNLRSLYNEDEYFKTVVIVLDNDVLENEAVRQFVEAHDTFLTLPAIVKEHTSREERTPEFQMYLYLKSLISNHTHEIWQHLPDGYTIENIEDIIVNEFPSENCGSQSPRELRKNWFNQHRRHFETLHIMKYFCKDNHSIIIPFINGIKNAIDQLIKSD